VVGGGAVPDLRRLPRGFHDSFQQIVRGGALESVGMPGFGDVLEEADATAIQAFVIEKAIEDRELREAPRWWLAVKALAYEVVSWLIAFVST
jgi:hypothetical protein